MIFVSTRRVGYFSCTTYHRHKIGTVRSIRSEIGVSQGSLGVHTDQWSQCLRLSIIAADFTVELHHTPVDLQRSILLENDLLDDIRFQDLLQVPTYQIEPLLPTQLFCHCKGS